MDRLLQEVTSGHRTRWDGLPLVRQRGTGLGRLSLLELWDVHLHHLFDAWGDPL
jgi:hypothetical protein